MDSAPGRSEQFPAHLVPYLLTRAADAFNRAWLRELRRHGITVPRWQVLAILSEYDGARLGQIAEMAAAEQPVTSRVVEQMERDGLVLRRPAPGDRRAVEVWRTPRGRCVFEELLPQATGLVSTALEGMPPEVHGNLVDALVMLVANLAEAPQAVGATAGGAR